MEKAHVLSAALVVASLVGLTGDGALAAASKWQEGDQHRSRLLLVAGENNTYLGGIEIAMRAGWHTYWRLPGDVGVPPQFDFSASKNVTEVKVLYPVPERMRDESGLSLIYRDRVVLPLRVRAADPGKPVTLSLSALFGVCEEICIPVKVSMSVVLAKSDKGDRPSRLAIEQALRNVPGAPEPGRLDVERARVANGEIIISLRAPPSREVELLAIGPDDWYLGQPEPAGRDGDRATFRLSLEGMPKDESPTGHAFTFVAVSGGEAIETKLTIQP